MARLPLPLSAADRDAGFWWDLTMRQVETSRTIVLDAPRHARAFFEALVADNLDLGRPESVELIFKRDPRGRKADGTFKTAVDRHAEGVTINVFYKHSRAKQYLKDGRTPAHRNRDQRRLRHRLPAPAAQPRRPAGQGPCDQPAAAGH